MTAMQRTNSDEKTITIRRDNGLGILNVFFTWLQRLHMMLEITREQIINKKKSLRLQNSKQRIIIINNLKKIELFKFF